MSNDLNLGKNKSFLADIEFAAARTKLDPAALAAVIDMEALKDRHGVWQETSKNPKSSAQGMTQFLTGTWLEQARTPGRYVNEEAKRLGLVDEHNHVVSG